MFIISLISFESKERTPQIMDNFLDNPKKVSDKYLKFTGIYPNHVTNKCKEYVDRIDTLQGEEFSNTLTFWTLETNCDQV